jgi:hypothetical protein
MFEDARLDESIPENQAHRVLTSRLSEALSIPILDGWSEVLWEAGVRNELIAELQTAGECYSGYSVKISESSWANNLKWLLRECCIKFE